MIKYLYGIELARITIWTWDHSAADPEALYEVAVDASPKLAFSSVSLIPLRISADMHGLLNDSPMVKRLQRERAIPNIPVTCLDNYCFPGILYLKNVDIQHPELA